MSQKEYVKNKLLTDGEISNLHCIQHGIWRLGALIHLLREEGHDIETVYNTEEVGRNTHYRLKPKQTLW